MTSRSTPVYRPASAALLRTSTFPGGVELPDDLGVFDGGDTQQALEWLAVVWQRTDVRAALETASPDLSWQVKNVVADASRDVRAVRRTVLAVMSYILRWRGRSTPFGLFAGVGVAQVGTGAKVRRGGDHRIAVRADAGWLDHVIARLHQCDELRKRLSVVANDVRVRRGTRTVAPGRAPYGAAAEFAPVEVSVRHSPPVSAALSAARDPKPFAALRTRLLRQFPHGTTQQIDGLLLGLLNEGLLVSNMSAPMTCLDALGHTCAQLAAAEAQSIPEIKDLVHELTAIHRQLSAAGSVHEPATAVAERMSALTRTTVATQVVDTQVDCDVQVPEAVVREARDAVEILFRLSPYPWGYPAWRDYHDRFRARYGIGSAVPVLDLVADSGLGFPANYLGSAHEDEARKLSERDERLLAYIQKAALDGSGELVLTEHVIDDLTGGVHAESAHTPPRIEVGVELHCASEEALARGRFTLTITGTPRPGSSMTGRHLHLLPDETRAAFTDTFTTGEPGAVAAQLSFAPRKRRNENVVRTGQLLPHIIPIAEHHGSEKDVIPVADLAVACDERRFYLIQLSTRRHVEPRVTHALEAGVQTPPLARFLAEITTARATVYKAFHFGAAARLPYLPRVRYRKTILSPARWLLSADDLPDHNASMTEWEAGFQAWRRRWHVPQHVALVNHDRRQPLDLAHRLHRRLLRTRLDGADRIEIRETAVPTEHGWLGRAHELLIPMVQHSRASPSQSPSPGAFHDVAEDAGHLPGDSTIFYAQVYGHPSRFDEILIEHLSGLLASFDEDLCWWFRRHRQMRHPEAGQYLAVYLCLPEPAHYGPTAERVATWADKLRKEGLVSQLSLATHEPQFGRYGHGAAMRYAQQVFCADSAATIAQLNAMRAAASPQPLAAASLVDLAACFAGSADEGMEWLVRDIRQERGWLDQDLRRRTLELADPHRAWTTVRSLPGGADVVAAWEKRGTALAAYRRELAEQRDPLPVLSPLLHGHHNRALGVDAALERITYRLARTCALRHMARHRMI